MSLSLITPSCEKSLASIISIKFPLNNFICISGVSGGGKSSLIIETLYKALSKKINNSNLKSLPFDSLVGDELVDKIIDCKLIEIDDDLVVRVKTKTNVTKALHR